MYYRNGQNSMSERERMFSNAIEEFIKQHVTVAKGDGCPIVESFSFDADALSAFIMRHWEDWEADSVMYWINHQGQE